MTDLTWCPAPYWHFGLWPNGGKVTPPVYRDLSIIEKDNRYHVGPVGMVLGSYEGAEADFNGHRYLANKPLKSQWSNEQKEEYLREYEPALRLAWLDAKEKKHPAMTLKADEFKQKVGSIQQQVEAILWARDAFFDIYGISSGPTNYLYRVCADLLHHFVTQYLPDYTTDHLMQGYHPALAPYYPLVHIAEAEQLAQFIGQGEICRAFEQYEITKLLTYLMEKHTGSPFMQKFENYCNRFSLLPPSRFSELTGDEKWPDYRTELNIVLATMQGNVSVTTVYDQATQRRQECEAQVRRALSEKAPDTLPRFEQLLDWSLFWGSVVNDRAWANVPGNRIYQLWTVMCRRLQSVGLVDRHTDIGYFTVEDLALIAQLGDIEEGRRIWKRRQHEYEYYDRLQAPEFLGIPPIQPTITNEQEQTVEPVQADAGLVIKGRGLVTGQASGTAHKIESLEEEHTVTDQDVLLFTKPINQTAGFTPILLSLMLRVQGMITQERLTNTTHIVQIARECGVPIVQVSPADTTRIPDGSMLSLDGSKGTVIIHT